MRKSFEVGGVKFSVNKRGDEVKVQVGKEVRYVKSLELWGVAFSFTKDPDMRAQLMPVQAKEIMKFKKVHTVQLKDDMKAGDTLKFTSIIDVPTWVVEGMRDIVAQEVPGSDKVLEDLLARPADLSTEGDERKN